MKAVMRYRRNGVAAVGIALLLAAVLGLATQNPATLPGQVGSRTAPSAGVASPASLSPPDEATRTRLSQAYGKLPLHFEANRGQAGSQVRFLSRGSGYSLLLTPTGAVLRLRQGSRGAGVVVHMHFLGAHPSPQLERLEPLPGKSHYFIGNDPSRWYIGIPHYARVRYPGIYPGIDLVFYGNQRQLEYDFVVAPGADPRAIRLGFEGTDRLGLDEGGNLVLHTAAGGQLLQHAPVIYQEVGGTRRAISGRYVLFGGTGRASDPGIQEVGFKVAAYDPARPLVIDPMLEYSTYLGGSGNEVGIGIAVDTSGNAYVTGSTSSANFPTAHPIQPARGGDLDVFVTKLNPEGSALVYSTYLGGSDSDEGNSIAVDTSGNAYVIGWTSSANFPTARPIQPAFGGGSDAFVVKLNPEGSALAYSTYLGGSGNEVAKGIAADTSGNAYVTGWTSSANFPTARPIQPALDGDSDAFVVKLNPEGSALVYSTYLGGSSDEIGFGGIAVDSFGSAYVTGGTSSTNFPTKHPIQPTYGGGSFGIFNSDVFVTKLSPEGSDLVYSTYLGGSGGELGFGIAVDSFGSAYVTGATSSTNFPTKHPIQPAFGGGLADAFVAKLNPEGSALVYSTYLGGSGDDGGFGITVDTSGNAYMAGGTRSPNFPTARPIQPALDGNSDAFVVKLNPEGSALVYSTYLGGNGTDNSGFGIAVDSSDNVYVTGVTPSSNFPTVHPFQRAYGGGSSDAFIAKIGDVEPAEPLLSVTPSSLDFGHVAVGSSTDRTLTVQNTGGGTLTGSASTGAPYSVVSGGSYSLAAGQSQSVTVRFRPTADGTFPGSIAFTGGGGGGGGGTVTVTGTGVTRVLVHDLAVTKVTAPKMITLTAKKPARTVQVKVQIQNRSPHSETLEEPAVLDKVLRLTVESWGETCPPLEPSIRIPQKALKLKPKQTLNVVFDVTFDLSCVPDRFKSTPADPGHDDYRYTATVDHAALDGEVDSHPADDICPRSITPPFEVDPNPDGKIKDKGCGGQNPDRTLGADVLTDMVVK